VVLIVRVDVNVGDPDCGVRFTPRIDEALTNESWTGWDIPLSKLTDMLKLADCPWFIVSAFGDTVS